MTAVRAVDDPVELARGAHIARIGLARYRARLAAEQQEPARAAG